MMPRSARNRRGSRRTRSHFLRLVLSWCGLHASAGCGSQIARNDASLFPPPARNAITFWGHSCCYIDVDGVGIVTDPVFEKHLLIRRRKVPSPPLSAYAATRIILVSHAHSDHLSPETLATFPKESVILCPEPSARYASGLGPRVQTMRPGDTYEFPGGRIIAVTADHPGERWAVVPVPDGRALGFIIETPQDTIYYSGDTEYFSGFKEVAATHAPSVAILNVTGHMRGHEAVRAARDLDVETVIPLHFAAFGYLFIGEYKKPRTFDTLQSELGSILVTLGLGESFPLGARPLQNP
ncbi:MAG: MBL fold metallo-hydrolase [Candidatus Latescibacterota bacterium]|nr:MAG: MBL fold metallo-hydrolase [Candidatus Latescibacterota bacterium]